jgi:hypothetical protein
MARLGARKSFAAVEIQARSVLRERGYSEEEIDVLLHLAKRETFDPEDLPRPPDGADEGDDSQ